jgi:hypothetical protein
MRANGNNRWVDLVPKLERHYNSQNVSGTSVRRSHVNQHNYLELLEQLFKTDDPTALFNLSSTDSYPPPIAKMVWRYDVGDKVILARRSDYALKDRHYFEKASVVGAYGPEVRTVVRRVAKHSGKLFVCPVYELSGLEGTFFYDSELRRALFAEDAGKRSSDDRLRKTRRKRKATAAAAAAK